MKTIIRITILLALLAAGLILILSEETDEGTLVLFLHFLTDKTAGILLLWGFGRLYSRWSRTDPWIARFERRATGQ